MKLRNLTLLVSIASLLVACAPPPASSPEPSASPSAPSGTAPSATPSMAPSASPSTAPAAPALDWTNGAALRPYHFNHVGGVYYDRLLDTILVTDGESATEVTPHYLFRKFKSDGTFVAEVAAARQGEPSPEAIDGVAFDLRGNPVFTYKNEDDEWRVYKLFTATVTLADRYPLHKSERAGTSTLSMDGNVLRSAVIALDPDETETTGGMVTVGIGNEDEPPQALFQVPDPFNPTLHMAFGKDGSLYLLGGLASGGFAIKRVSPAQAVEDVTALSSLPDGMFVGPQGNLYLTSNTTSGPASVRKFSPDGNDLGSTEVKLKDGGYLTTIRGLTFDAQDRPIIAGLGFDAASNRIEGLYVFEK